MVNHLVKSVEHSNDQLSSSYARHPDFKFNRPALEIDIEQVKSFVESYEAIRTFNSHLAKNQFEAYKRRCEAMLSTIFAALGRQTDDQYEILFLKELRGECERLLQEEVDHFRAGVLRGYVSFKGEVNERDALRLVADKFYFGRLPASVVSEFLAMGAMDLNACRVSALQGRVMRSDLSVNSGLTVRRMAQVLNREFRVAGVLDAVSAYAGRRMSVTGLALELSVPHATWWLNGFGGLDRPPRTLYAHIDESILYPKSIVYLTEVDEKSGPTGCYPNALPALGLNPLQEIVGRVLANVGSLPGSSLQTYYDKKYHQSMSSARFRQHFMRLPNAIRFNSHLGWDICPGSPMEKSLADSEKLLLGAPGSFIVFDGARLLHRGGMVREGERIALQVVFSSATPVKRVLGKIRRALA